MKKIFSKRNLGFIIILIAYEFGAYIICNLIFLKTKSVPDSPSGYFPRAARGGFDDVYNGPYKNIEVFNDDLFLALNLFLIVIVLVFVGIWLIRISQNNKTKNIK